VITKQFSYYVCSRPEHCNEKTEERQYQEAPSYGFESCRLMRIDFGWVETFANEMHGAANGDGFPVEDGGREV
jgi:hypothetical protein